MTPLRPAAQAELTQVLIRCGQAAQGDLKQVMISRAPEGGSQVKEGNWDEREELEKM